MDKPTVFLSHSVKDAAVIRKLKVLLDDKTGGAIDWWLSCDGQSLPLGRNWVAEVQLALERSRLLFCFLTPASLHSAWVHFEAGFAHRGKVDVVPVGLPGVDVANAPGAMSFLQGFNVRDHHSLNNIIQKVNDLFNAKHKLSFTEADFADIFSGGEADSSPAARLDALFSEAVLGGSYKIRDTKPLIQAVTEIGLPFQLTTEKGDESGRFVGPGLDGTWHHEGGGIGLHYSFEPGALPDYLPILDVIAPQLKLKAYNQLSLLFRPGIIPIMKASRVLRLIKDSDIEWIERRTYRLEELEFEFTSTQSLGFAGRSEGTWMHNVNTKYYMMLKMPKSVSTTPLAKLLDILITRNIIEFLDQE